MVNISTIKNNLTTLLDGIYARINHTHGNIDKDGKVKKNNIAQTSQNVVTDSSGSITTEAKPTIPTKTSQLTNDSGFLTQHQNISGKLDRAQGSSNASKNVVTDSSGNITTEAKDNHSHGYISSDGYIGKGMGDAAAYKPVITNADGKITLSNFGTTQYSFCEGNDSRLKNVFTDERKNKLDALSTYQIRLTDIQTENINSALLNNPSYPDYPHILYVHKNQQDSQGKYGQIFCLVTKNKTTRVESGKIIFIINGQTYVKDIDDGYAILNIHLNAKEYNIIEYIQNNNIVLQDAIYTVTAIYRPDGEWTEAIDVKQMKVSDSNS